MHEWKEKKRRQAECGHTGIRCVQDVMINGRFIMRFFCDICEKKFTSLQMNTNDEDRVIESKKHPGKTLGQIAKEDMPYLFWVAVKSKMNQPERYACARMCDGKPYVVPSDGDVISYDALYEHYVKSAVDFITSNGGTI